MNSNNPIQDPFNNYCDALTEELFSFGVKIDLNIYLWSNEEAIEWSDGSFATY